MLSLLLLPLLLVQKKRLKLTLAKPQLLLLPPLRLLHRKLLMRSPPLPLLLQKLTPQNLLRPLLRQPLLKRATSR